MPEASSMERTEDRLGPPLVTTILAASAGLFVGLHLVLALGGEDVERYESPLMLSVARQLVAGPRELYGPFGRRNPLVLIHAPLYYRAAALAAWPLARAGLHPVDAARVAGRLISIAGLAATMGAAYRLGRLGGLTRRAGWWAALLVAAAPALGGQPFAVRPDLMGVALQTWGVALALGPGRRLGTASALFSLAACVKQHLLAAWAVTVVLAARGRWGVARVVLPGAAVAGLVYGVEWLVTGGRIWEAAFMAAAQVGRVHPGDWLHVGTVIAAIVGKNAGLAAPAIAGAAGERIWSRGRVAIGASSLVGAIMLLAAAQLVRPVPWIAGLLTAAALAALLIALTGWLRPLRTSKGDGEIDAALGLYCGAEVVVLVVLCRSSSGAWINYGIPAVVFASVLAARSLARAAEARPRGWPVIAALASTAVLASVLMDAKVETSRRRAEHAELARLVAATGLPPSSVFFADRPGLNRMSGRLEWVYDDWLYPAFESLKLAEPRARWLPPAQGPRSEVRALVLEPDGDRLDGLSEPLSALGFRPGGRFGPFRVWTLGSPGRWAP